MNTALDQWMLMWSGQPNHIILTPNTQYVNKNITPDPFENKWKRNMKKPVRVGGDGHNHFFQTKSWLTVWFVVLIMDPICKLVDTRTN